MLHRSPRTTQVRSLVLTAATLLLASDPAFAGEQYFIAVFASESVPYNPKNTHSFAAAIRVCGPQIEMHSISWLPRTLEIRPFRVHPEPGTNLGLKETIEWARASGMVVSAWGPYEIQEELYHKFVALKARLEKPGQTYAVPSKPYAWRGAIHCAHALLALTEKRQSYIGPFGYGEPVSARVVASFAPWIRHPDCPHWEIIIRWGLDHYSILPRDYSYRPTRRDSLHNRYHKDAGDFPLSASDWDNLLRSAAPAVPGTTSATPSPNPKKNPGFRGNGLIPEFQRYWSERKKGPRNR